VHRGRDELLFPPANLHKQNNVEYVTGAKRKRQKTISSVTCKTFGAEHEAVPKYKTHST
jgi:hypothetical protein